MMGSTSILGFTNLKRASEVTSPSQHYTDSGVGVGRLDEKCVRQWSPKWCGIHDAGDDGLLRDVAALLEQMETEILGLLGGVFDRVRMHHHRAGLAVLVPVRLPEAVQ